MNLSLCTGNASILWYVNFFSTSGAFCKVHSAVLVSEETGYLIERHVAVKHLKGMLALGE